MPKQVRHDSLDGRFNPDNDVLGEGKISGQRGVLSKRWCRSGFYGHGG